MILSTKIFLSLNRYLKLKKIIEVQVLVAQTVHREISFFKKTNRDFPIKKFIYELLSYQIFKFIES